MRRACSMCRTGRGEWPIHGGGKVCYSCKYDIESCERQRGNRKPKYAGKEPMQKQKSWW